MIEKWVIFKRDYLEISFLRENCGYDGSDERRRYSSQFSFLHYDACIAEHGLRSTNIIVFQEYDPFILKPSLIKEISAYHVRTRRALTLITL